MIYGSGGSKSKLAKAAPSKRRGNLNGDQNGDCWASTKWLPNAGAVSSLQKSIMKYHDLMNPKMVSLHKFTGILTCPKKSQQHVPTKVNWCYLLVCKMVYLQKLGVWGTFFLQNPAPTAFCIGLKASMFVVEIGTGIDKVQSRQCRKAPGTQRLSEKHKQGFIAAECLNENGWKTCISKLMKIQQSTAVLRGHRFGPGHPALAVLGDMHFRAVITFGSSISHLYFRSPTLWCWVRLNLCKQLCFLRCSLQFLTRTQDPQSLGRQRCATSDMVTVPRRWDRSHLGEVRKSNAVQCDAMRHMVHNCATLQSHSCNKMFNKTQQRTATGNRANMFGRAAGWILCTVFAPRKSGFALGMLPEIDGWLKSTFMFNGSYGSSIILTWFPNNEKAVLLGASYESNIANILQDGTCYRLQPTPATPHFQCQDSSRTLVDHWTLCRQLSCSPC